MSLKRLLSDRQIWVGLALIFILSIVLGVASHPRLIKRFLAGEFRQAFILKEDFPQLAFISLSEAEEVWSGQKAVFVDSRSREEFNRGHIPGAISIPLEDLKNGQEDLLTRIFDSPEIVIYCEGGDCQASLNLARILDSRGFKKLKIFLGGWAEWMQSGLPVETNAEE
ncbi:MAG TPA: rhodanese-like domain-containing protein [Candidatus Saccharicenans sp.]|jgi:rhodanese-related sulfurtransferase|nr:rhodanese-like domain-containing protein [Candidatus Saccharicenans sp.]HRD01874.1 rhodanese-like domain-containing protein [Candidatus Saccharicenans sp.]